MAIKYWYKLLCHTWPIFWVSKLNVGLSNSWMQMSLLEIIYLTVKSSYCSIFLHIWRWRGYQHSWPLNVWPSSPLCILILTWSDCFDQSKVDRIQCKVTLMISVLVSPPEALVSHVHKHMMGSFHWILLFLYWVNNDIYPESIHYL